MSWNVVLLHILTAWTFFGNAQRCLLVHVINVQEEFCKRDKQCHENRSMLHEKCYSDIRLLAIIDTDFAFTEVIDIKKIIILRR